jgi:hypothetical protein
MRICRNILTLGIFLIFIVGQMVYPKKIPKEGALQEDTTSGIPTEKIEQA